MLDAHAPVPAVQGSGPGLQRSRGRAAVRLGACNGRTVLRDLHQSGCAKAMLPRTHGPCPEVVFLNTAGGVTGGDTLQYALDLGPGCAGVAATQTAERAYRSIGTAGHIDVTLSLGSGARLDWLPQETILFDASNTVRRTQADMAGDATLLWAEMLVMGRAAMGESIETVSLRDLREVRRAGRLVLAEPLELSPASLAAPAGLDTARAIATIAFLSPDAEDARDALRALDFADVTLAVSAWDGKLIARAIARDAQPLKQAVATLVTTLRRGAPLPRVWQV
ncbi:urease accessory protein UreD [Tropicimonas sp. S265A]|uniref:urease accessory protein UreD n=1 Tax=Tropicimonas sp. S265A TaxID=3415134 RepID=UPI003C7C70CA